MQQGAFNYLLKPLDLAQLRAVVEQGRPPACGCGGTNAELNRRLDEKFGFEGVIGTSPKMHDVIDRLKRIAPTDATRAHPGGHRHRQGAGRAGHPPEQPAKEQALRGAELRRLEREHSGERAVRPRERGLHRRLDRPDRQVRVRQRRARCFWTKSATCRWPRRSSCCACWRTAKSRASARTSRSRSTCGSFRPRTATWRTRSPPARSAAICITG